MRIITLNAWGGRSMHPLMRFFRHRAGETDVFCLQEMFDADQSVLDARHPDEHLRGDVFKKVAAELTDFQGFFSRFEDPNRMSNAVFVRRSVPVLSIVEPLVYVPAKPVDTGSKVISARKLQCLTLQADGRNMLVANLHGMWAGPKTDTPDRVNQSRIVVEVLKSHAGPKVLCGDFNLLPCTEAMRILMDEAGLRNLVVEHRVASTRTPLYRHYHDPAEPNFADYVMPSPDLKVMRFEVLPDIVSDHAPLCAELV